MRHGEALHNTQWRKHSTTLDTPLTERGGEQAHRLAGHPALVQCTLLVVSPLTRAIETAVAIYGRAPECRACICALHSERVDNERAACNHGSPRTTLATRFPFLHAWEGFDELPEVPSPHQPNALRRLPDQNLNHKGMAASEPGSDPQAANPAGVVAYGRIGCW